MGHQVAAHLGAARTWRLGFPPRAGGGQGGGWCPRVSLGLADTYPSTYINPPCTPWLIHPSPSSLLSGLAPMFWSRARELEETPYAGHRRAIEFPVPVYLLPSLCWILA
jgi:hypothetical protein